MRTKPLIITFMLLLASLVFSACTGLIPVTGPDPADIVATQEAQVVDSAIATATQSAMQTEIAYLYTQVAAVETQAATPTALPATPTLEPTATATQVPPSPTPVLPTATITPTPLPCNAAEFVADVTIPDGSLLAPNAYFTKTWRLRNIGACTWTRAYQLVFVSGDRMEAPASVELPADVYPGQVVDVTVGLVAPSHDGSFRGYWKIRDAAGLLFGVGRSGSAFYVDIRVEDDDDADPLDLAASYCSAEWTTGAGRIPCQGDSNDSRGSVRRVSKPTLETGYIDDEPALFVQPQAITDGVIRGKFPAVRIKDGYSFTALIGCANKSKGCDVNFQLDYQIGNGSIHTLGVWHEVYDEEYQIVNVDLSGLAGEDVKFILTVFANGSPSNDRAHWLAPRINK